MGDEVKKLVQGLRSGQVNVNLFCGQFKKLVEKRVLLTKGNLVAQLSNLRQAVEIFSHVRLSLPNSILVEEIGRDLFLKCARMVLSVTYLLSPPCQEINFFKNSVYRAEKMLRNTGYGHRFDMLRWLMYNNWKHPTLSKLVWGFKLNEDVGTQYVRKMEFPELLKLRVEILMDEGDCDLALNLCGWCLRVHMNDPFLLAVMLMFLHHQQKYALFYSLCHCLGPCLSAQVMNYIEPEARLTQSFLKIAQTLLLQDWMKPQKYCCTRALLEHWLEAEYNMEQRPGDFEFAVLKVADCAHNRYQIMLLLSIIRDMFGLDHMQLYIDLCMLCLKRNIADLQLDCVKKDEREWKDAHTSLSYICTSLSCICNGWSLKLRRLSLLTAFSLEPRYDLFRALEKLYETPVSSSQSANQSVGTAAPSSAEPHAGTSQSVDCKTGSTQPSDSRSTTVVIPTCPPAQTSIYQGHHRTLQQAMQTNIRGVSPQSLMEIIKTLEYLRMPGLDPTLPWEDLKNACFDYIENGKVNEERLAATPHVPIISENDDDPLDVLYTDCVKVALDEETIYGKLPTNVEMPWETSRDPDCGSVHQTEVTPMEVDGSQSGNGAEGVGTNVIATNNQSQPEQSREVPMVVESECVDTSMQTSKSMPGPVDVSASNSQMRPDNPCSGNELSVCYSMASSSAVTSGSSACSDHSQGPPISQTAHPDTKQSGSEPPWESTTSISWPELDSNQNLPTFGSETVGENSGFHDPFTGESVVRNESLSELADAGNESRIGSVMSNRPDQVLPSDTHANIGGAESVPQVSTVAFERERHYGESACVADAATPSTLSSTCRTVNDTDNYGIIHSIQTRSDYNLASYTDSTTPFTPVSTLSQPLAGSLAQVFNPGAVASNNFGAFEKNIACASPVISSDRTVMDAVQNGNMNTNGLVQGSLSETPVTPDVPICKQRVGSSDDLVTAEVEIPRHAVSSHHDDVTDIPAAEVEKVCDEADHSDCEITSVEDAECAYIGSDDGCALERDRTNTTSPSDVRELTPVAPAPISVSDSPFPPTCPEVDSHSTQGDNGITDSMNASGALSDTNNTFSALDSAVDGMSDSHSDEPNPKSVDNAAQSCDSTNHVIRDGEDASAKSDSRAELLPLPTVLSDEAREHDGSAKVNDNASPENSDDTSDDSVCAISAISQPASSQTLPGSVATEGLSAPVIANSGVEPALTINHTRTTPSFTNSISQNVTTPTFESAAAEIVSMLPASSDLPMNIPNVKSFDEAIVVASSLVKLNSDNQQSDYVRTSTVSQTITSDTKPQPSPFTVPPKLEKPIEHTVMVASPFVQPDLSVDLKQTVEKPFLALDHGLTQIPATSPPVLLGKPGKLQAPLIPKIPSLSPATENAMQIKSYPPTPPSVSDRILTIKSSLQRMVPLKPKPPKVFEMPHVQSLVTSVPPVLPPTPQPMSTWAQLTPQPSIVTSNILDTAGLTWSQSVVQSTTETSLSANTRWPSPVQMVPPQLLQPPQTNMLNTLPLQMALPANNSTITMVQSSTPQIVVPQTSIFTPQNISMPQVVAQSGLPNILNQGHLSEIVGQQPLPGIVTPQQLPGIVGPQTLSNVLNQQQMSLVASPDASNVVLAQQGAGLVLLVPNPGQNVANGQAYLAPASAFSTQPALASASQTPVILNPLSASQTIANFGNTVLQSAAPLQLGTVPVSVGQVLSNTSIGTPAPFQPNQFQLPGNQSLLPTELMPAANVISSSTPFMPTATKSVTVAPAIRPLVLGSSSQTSLTPSLSSSSLPVNTSFVAVSTSSFAQPPTSKLFQALTDLQPASFTEQPQPHLKVQASISTPIVSAVSITSKLPQHIKSEAKALLSAPETKVMPVAESKCPCGQLPQMCCCSPTQASPIATPPSSITPVLSAMMDTSCVSSAAVGASLSAVSSHCAAANPSVLSTSARAVTPDTALNKLSADQSSVVVSEDPRSGEASQDADGYALMDVECQDAGTQTDPVDDEDEDEMDGFINSADAAAEAGEVSSELEDSVASSDHVKDDLSTDLHQVEGHDEGESSSSVEFINQHQVSDSTGAITSETVHADDSVSILDLKENQPNASVLTTNADCVIAGFEKEEPSALQSVPTDSKTVVDGDRLGTDAPEDVSTVTLDPDESCERDSLVDTRSVNTADNEADIESQAESQELDELNSDEVVLLSEGSDLDFSQSSILNETDSLFDNISAATNASVDGAHEAGVAEMSEEVGQVPDPIHTDTADSQSSSVSSHCVSREPAPVCDPGMTDNARDVSPMQVETEAVQSVSAPASQTTGPLKVDDKNSVCDAVSSDREAANVTHAAVKTEELSCLLEGCSQNDGIVDSESMCRGQSSHPRMADSPSCHGLVGDVKPVENKVHEGSGELMKGTADDVSEGRENVTRETSAAAAAAADLCDMSKDKPGTPQAIIHDIRPMSNVSPHPLTHYPESSQQSESISESNSAITSSTPSVKIENISEIPKQGESDDLGESKMVTPSTPERATMTLPPSTYTRFTDNKQALEAGVQRAQKDGSPISDTAVRDTSSSNRPIVRKFFTSRDVKQSPPTAVVLTPVTKSSPTPCPTTIPAPPPKSPVASSSFSPADLTKFLVESIQSSEALTPQKIQAAVLKLIREKWPEVNRQNGGGPRFTLSSDLNAFKIIVDVGPGKPPCTIQFAQTTKKTTQGATPEKKTLVTVKGGAGLQKELNEALKDKTKVTIKPKSCKMPKSPNVCGSSGTKSSSSGPSHSVKCSTGGVPASPKSSTSGSCQSVRSGETGPTLSPKSSAIFQSRMQSYRKLASSFNLSGVQPVTLSSMHTAVSTAPHANMTTTAAVHTSIVVSSPVAVTSPVKHKSVSQTSPPTVTTPSKSVSVPIKPFKLTSSPCRQDAPTSAVVPSKTLAVETTCTTSVSASSVQTPSCPEATQSVSSCKSTTSVLPITCESSIANITALSERNPELKAKPKEHAVKTVKTKGGDNSEKLAKKKAAIHPVEETTSSDKCNKPSQRKRRCDSSDSAGGKKCKSEKNTEDIVTSDQSGREESAVDGSTSQSGVGDVSSSEEDNRQVTRRALRNTPGRLATPFPSLSELKTKSSKITQSKGALHTTEDETSSEVPDKAESKVDKKTSKNNKSLKDNSQEKSAIKDTDHGDVGQSGAAHKENVGDQSKEVRKTPVKSRLRHRPHMASYWEEDWSSGSDDSSDEEVKITSTSRPRSRNLKKKAERKLDYKKSDIETKTESSDSECPERNFSNKEDEKKVMTSPQAQIKESDSGYIKAFADWVSDGTTVMETASETGSSCSSPVKEMVVKPVGLRTYSRLCPTVSPDSTPTVTSEAVSDVNSPPPAPPSTSEPDSDNKQEVPDTKVSKVMQISPSSSSPARISCAHSTTKVIYVAKRVVAATPKTTAATSAGFQNAFTTWSKTGNKRAKSEEPSGSDPDDGVSEREFTDWFRGKTYQGKSVQNSHVSPQPKISRAEEQFMQVLAKEKVRKAPASEVKIQPVQTLQPSNLSENASQDTEKKTQGPGDEIDSFGKLQREPEGIGLDNLMDSDSDSEIDFPKDPILRRSSSVESRCSVSSLTEYTKSSDKQSKNTSENTDSRVSSAKQKNSCVRDLPTRSGSRQAGGEVRSREVSPLPATVLSQKREKLRTPSREASPASSRGRRSASKETDVNSPAAAMRGRDPSPSIIPAKRKKGELELLLDVDLKFDASPKSRGDSSTRSKGHSRESSPAFSATRKRESGHSQESSGTKKDADEKNKDSDSIANRGHHRTRTKGGDGGVNASVDSSSRDKSRDRVGGGGNIDSGSTSKDKSKVRNSSGHDSTDSCKDTSSDHAARDKNKDRNYILSRLKTDTVSGDEVASRSKRSSGKNSTPGTAVKRKSEGNTAVPNKRRAEDSNTLSNMPSSASTPRRLSQRKSTSPWETEYLKRLGKL